VVEPLLEVRSLVRRYGERPVIDIESLELRHGEVLAIVGPNGAGKSTLFRLLLLLERPDAGTILIGGRPANPAAVRARVAGVFQRPILFSGTVRDNVAYGLRTRGLARRERDRRTAAALQWFELEGRADVGVHTLSGGEVQRVALARALVLEPDVLLLDEPTANLDVTVRRRFREDLVRVARQHARGIVLITHDAAEAVALADRVAVLHHGRVVQTGTPEEIVLRPGTPFVAALTGAELLLHGAVEAVEDELCAVGIAPDTRLWATMAEAAGIVVGAAAIVAYRPEDVVLGPVDGAAETSAINRLEVTVDALAVAGGLVRVLLRWRGLDGPAGAAGPRLAALLTRRSAESLALEPGRRVIAHLKATALHAWPRAV
jgi:ABC-type Fe3+/spermidine/putrescine transport system ATPase subunit